jgi:glyoxylase-like metal-dependent hydrolase (beta-lactamase superfamily II)
MLEHACFTLDAEPARPGFVAAYLRTTPSGELAFIETNTAHSLPILLEALRARALSPEAVRYVIVTHAHLDHAGGAGALMAACPNATLLAHPRAARHLIDPAKLVASATSVYGAARFAALYGVIAPIPAARVRALDDGVEVPLGDATLRFIHTRGHAKHHFVVHDPTLDAVFTGDALGLVYPLLQRAGRFALASTSPTDFEPEEALRAIALIVGLGARTAYLTHFGGFSDVAAIGAAVARCVEESHAWLREAVATGAPVAEMKARIEGHVREALARHAAEVGLELGAADWELLATDVDLNAQGIAFVADKTRREAASGAPAP